VDSGRVIPGIFVLSALAAGLSPPSPAQELPEVIVTAQKRPEVAESVPITLTDFDAAAFDKSDSKDLLQIANYVPGFVFSRAPDDGLALSLRGVGSPARTQAFDQSVAVFLDGLFLGKGRLYTQALFDVDNLDVLKGSQNTLLGRNASAGAITIESRPPSDTMGLEARTGFELEHGGETVDAAADLPVSSDSTVRLAGHYNDTNGWVKNLTTGREVPIDRDGGVRVTGRLHPDDGFDATLMLQHSTDFRIGVPYQIVDPNLPAIYGEGVFNDEESEYTARTPEHETTHQTVSNLVNLKFEGALGSLHAVSQTGYVEYGLHFDDDFDFSNQPWTDFIRDESYSQATEELRFLSPSGEQPEYLFGAFVLHSRWHSVEQQLWGVPGFPPDTPIAGQLFNGPFTDDFSQVTDSQALFGQFTWHFSDDWQGEVGLRATHERKDVVYGRHNAAPLTLWNTVDNPPFPYTPLHFEQTFPDGGASIERHITSSAMAYLAYSHGTKTGGFAETNTVASANPAVDARISTERTQNFELGVKSIWRGGSLRINASVFHTDIKDFQDTTFTGTAFITENLPLTSKGADLDSEWQALAGLRLGAGVTYADSLERPTALDAANGIRCDPCRATQAPLWNGSGHIEYQHSMNGSYNWELSSHLRYRGAMFNQRGDLYPATSFMPIDLGLEVFAKSQRYGASLLAKNIANRLTEDFSSPSVAPYFAGLASPAPLRTITLSIWVHY
jgi:iron complex outermembrane recepter protein